MNSDIFIPVRLKSTRLPKKAILEFDGKPIIQYLIERLHNAKTIRNIVICTTTDASDDELVSFLEKEKVLTFRGSEKDILQRFLDAATKFNTDFIIIVDGDDIYSDPFLVDEVVHEYTKSNVDCVKITNVPVGFTTIGVKKSALENICKLKKSNNTETGYANFFTLQYLSSLKELKPQLIVPYKENLRLSLDYQEDFDVAKEIFKNLGNDFHMDDVLKLLQKRQDLVQSINNLEERWSQHWNQNLADNSIRDK